mgnify:CR=1 FL=1
MAIILVAISLSISFSFLVFNQPLQLLITVAYSYSTITVITMPVTFYTLHQSIAASSTPIPPSFSSILPFFSYHLTIKISSFNPTYYFYRPFWSFIKIVKFNIFHHNDHAFFVMFLSNLLCLLFWCSLIWRLAIVIVFGVIWLFFPMLKLFESLLLIFLVTHFDLRPCIVILVCTCRWVLLMFISQLTIFHPVWYRFASIIRQFYPFSDWIMYYLMHFENINVHKLSKNQSILPYHDLFQEC